jgi:Tol biopolymer transport system component
MLTVSVSPDVLWPPNHTLSTIHASITVSDVCDPAPAVRLLSITSSEPDSGTGPRDIKNDIQGASFGTDDRLFRLRAEHSPGGVRTYTITYAAQDAHGNSMTASATVRVPKSGATLISRDGEPANGPSWAVAIDTDGSVVAFSSDATNLVRFDSNQVPDVFVRDRTPGTTERVSVASGGTQANGASRSPSLNGNGSVVAFASVASKLVLDDGNGRSDVFVRDRGTGMTERVSVAGVNTEANGGSFAPSISADGNFVAFHSLASNLVGGDTNRAADIFARDIASQTTERLCGGVQGDRFSITPAISADASVVAFASAATNLVPGDTNRRLDIFTCDRATGTLERVSVSSDGEQADGDSLLPAVSEDGRFVAFKSSADNLVPDDHNGFADVFVHDRVTGTTERVSVDPHGGDADNISFPPSISHDGRFVAFGSLARNLVRYDVNATSNVFVRDRETATTYLVDVNDEGEEANRGTPDIAPAITGDGVQIGFVSLASNLAGRDNDANDVFVVCNPALATPPSFASAALGNLFRPPTRPHPSAPLKIPGLTHTVRRRPSPDR